MISIDVDKVSDDKKVEILNDHYKDTCLKLAGYRKQRNRLVFYAALTMFITFFMVLVPTETLRIVASIFVRTSIDDLIKNTDNLPYIYSARLIPGLILAIIAFTYKHYRISMDSQFAYVKMLESELNSLYPESNLFNRETNYSSKESNSYAMWSSQHYSKILKVGSLLSAIVYVNLFFSGENRISTDEVVVGIYGILACLMSALFFGTRKPLTDANIHSLVTSGKEIE